MGGGYEPLPIDRCQGDVRLFPFFGLLPEIKVSDPMVVAEAKKFFRVGVADWEAMKIGHEVPPPTVGDGIPENPEESVPASPVLP
jgi:hypothetical protein